jgi:hypothetical protein
MAEKRSYWDGSGVPNHIPKLIPHCATAEREYDATHRPAQAAGYHQLEPVSRPHRRAFALHDRPPSTCSLLAEVALTAESPNTVVHRCHCGTGDDGRLPWIGVPASVSSLGLSCLQRAMRCFPLSSSNFPITEGNFRVLLWGSRPSAATMMGVWG